MKKFLPLIVFIVAAVFVVGAFLVVKSNNKTEESVEEDTTEETVPEVSFDKRPVVSLVPSSDGHWLKLKITKLVIDSQTLDYEMTYKVPDGRTLGVPGTAKLSGGEEISKDLLLGSESSGKFRYDEGVEKGNLVLRFRNGNGKLVAKFETEFMLLNNVGEIPVFEGETFTFDKKDTKNYFVAMDTIGYPGDPSGEPKATFGIFTSSKNVVSGVVGKSDSYLWYKDEWLKLDDGKSPDVGYFLQL